MERARQIVARANLRAEQGRPRLPQIRRGQTFLQETKDALQLEAWKTNPRLSIVVSSFLSSQLYI